MTAQLVAVFTRPDIDLGSLCNAEEAAVARALRWGRSEARQIAEIAADAGLPERQTQDVIQHLLLDHRLPIGTSMGRPAGNYLIDSAEELEETVRLLRTRGISNLVRAAALKRMTLEEFLRRMQTELVLEQDGR